jgi:hypothetical protein
MQASLDLVVDKGYSVSQGIVQPLDEESADFYKRNTSTVLFYSIYSTLSPGAGRILDRIHSFEQLKKGWDGANAEVPSSKVIAEAKKFVREADQKCLPFYFAAPGPDGEVVVEFREKEKEAGVYFSMDEEPLVVLCEGNKVVMEGLLSEYYTTMIRFLNA